MLFLSTNDCKEYRLEGCLLGHKNAINCLAVTRNGNMLASGVPGSDGMRIWDLKRRVQLPTPRQTPAIQNPADPVTCACWITRQEATRETLCYGTGLGFIAIWQQQGEGLEDFNAKIMCLTYDHTGDDTHIATGTRDRRVQVWAFDFKGPLIPIFSVELSTTIPRTVNFNRTPGRNLCTSMSIHISRGLMIVLAILLRGSDGTVIATNKAGPMIGHAAVDAPQTLFLIDNVMNGFSLHQLEDGACLRTYNTNPVKTFPKQVVFGEQATLVVGGSDTGAIHIFDKNEGRVKQVLQHADRGRVQTVMTYNSTHHSLIFGATSTNDSEPTISIWCRKRTISPSDRPLGTAIKNFVRGIVQLAIAMAIMAYVIGQTSGITLLGNAWQEYSKPRAQTDELMNADIRSLVEQYIEAQRGEELERARSSGMNRRHDGRSKLVKPQEDMLHAVILLGN
ncbi:WD40-repeat-containing domain protein [Suillus clintonianus]|uniref:WD40-repeat-containing domain protein n=1 Tax=Suillus clintonianus TaxID=1904413 RepID=UPI001B877E57|nr:WD40-repeat-containing domain protein [Suillus clintonianus]KAG2135313.1 WD40-repeat-containing domain protein [Suillus clintonianus]